jgi:beta-lactam-binding protein with PASTA domain
VSLGPSPVYLPYVIGSSESRARSRLEGVGLVVTESTQSVSNSSSNGVVLDESPSPGSQVPGGSTVTLTVGQYAPPPNG